jgi:hypothetical protein
MAKLDEVERTAIDLIRGAGRYGVYLTHLGFEVAGVADWLENQIPRVRHAFDVIATVATTECERAAHEFRGGGDRHSLHEDHVGDERESEQV